MSNLIGQSLGRYHILEQLGEGGMATVYKAYDTRLERDVAVKIIRKSAFSPEVLERMLKRFEREAKALSKLTHPNIVGVIDYGDYEGSPYIVMEYLPGGTLKQRLGKPIPWQDAARILLPIARALQFAHGQGIIHRDVKPSNILITLSGEPMLSDFGIAKILESEETQTLTGTGIGVGTPEYMAPEQWTGQVTPQSDVYSLGVVFYEMITGRKPYVADTPAAVLLKQATEPLPRPAQYVPGLPDSIEKMLLKALARKPEDRYPDMAAFADGLDHLLAGQPKAKQPAAIAKPIPPKAEPVADTQATVLQEDTYATRLQEATQDEMPSPSRAVRPKPSSVPVQPQKKKTVWWPWAIGLAGVMGLVLVLFVVLVVSGPIIGDVYTIPAAAEAPTEAPILPATEPPISLALPVLQGTPYPQPIAAISPENAADVVHLARWGNGSVEEVAWSPDGQQIAVASSLGIYLYDSQTLEEIRFIDTNSFVASVAFSPDGSLLASGSWDNTARIWKVSDGSLMRILNGHTGRVRSVAFSPDGIFLATGSDDGTARLWHVTDGLLLSTMEGYTWGVDSVTFSPDGSLLAVGGNTESGDNVRLWRVAARTLAGIFHMTEPAMDVDFSPDGMLVIAGGGHGNIWVWQVADGIQLQTLRGHEAAIKDVTISPDGQLIGSTAYDHTARIWNIVEGKQIQFLEKDAESISFSPDGSFLAFGGEQIEVLQTDSLKISRTSSSKYASYITNIDYSPDGMMLASSSNYKSQLWGTSDGMLLWASGNETGGPIAFSPDGNKIAIVTDNTIQLRQVSNGTIIQTFNTSEIACVAFSPDGNVLASASYGENTVRLWRVSDGVLLQTLQGHSDEVMNVAFSRDGNILASGSYDNTVRLWRVSDGALLQTLEGHTNAVSSVAFSPDGQVIASASDDSTVRLWRVSDGVLIHILEGHIYGATSVTFSPDGQVLASGAYDNNVRLWQVSDGRLLQTLKGHTSGIWGVIFSPDGRVLASASGDGTIRLWGVVP